MVKPNIYNVDGLPPVIETSLTWASSLIVENPRFHYGLLPARIGGECEMGRLLTCAVAADQIAAWTEMFWQSHEGNERVRASMAETAWRAIWRSSQIDSAALAPEAPADE
jgi:hypothetical protein